MLAPIETSIQEAQLAYLLNTETTPINPVLDAIRRLFGKSVAAPRDESYAVMVEEAKDSLREAVENGYMTPTGAYVSCSRHARARIQNAIDMNLDV